MAQAIWQFVSNTGHKHKIGLYHGDSTGHLLIYCGAKVVKIDFNVKTQAVYEFFVDDEFCRVTLFQEPNGSFTYGFEVDKQVNTPLNAIRKKDEKRNNRLLWLLSGAILLVLIGFSVGLRAWQRTLSSQHSGWAGVMYFPSKEKATPLHTRGTASVATLILEPDGKSFKYQFQGADAQIIEGRVALPSDQMLPLLPNGFELRSQDQYQVRYDSLDKDVYLIDFLAPTPDQIRRFATRALEAELRKKVPQQVARCLVQTVLEERGWEHLQHVINQFVSPTANVEHNSDSYLRLCRDPEFERIYKQRCW